MFKKRSKEDQIIFFIVGILYVFSVSLSVLASTVLDVPSFYLFLVSAAFILLFYFVFYNQYTFYISTGVTVFILLYLFIALRGADQETHAYYEFRQFLHDTIYFVRGYLPYDDKYTWIIVLFVCFLIALYVSLSLYVTFQFYLLAVLGLGVYTIGWIMNYRRSDLSFLVFLFCFFVLLSIKMSILRARALPVPQAADNRVSVLSAMPICLLAVATALFTPSPTSKPDATAAHMFFQRPISTVNEFFYLAFHPKYFSFLTTGFAGQNNRLGGRVTLSDQAVMDVRSDSRTYLAGAIKDIYTGSSWVNQADLTFLPYQSEQAAAEYTESRFNLMQLYWQRFYEQTELQKNDLIYASLNGLVSATPSRMSIDIGNALTGTLFRPTKSVLVEYSGDYELLLNSHGDLRADRLLPANTSYSYRYLSLDFGSDVLKKILQDCHKGYYDRMLRYYVSISGLPFNRHGLPEQYTKLADHAQSIYDIYTFLPETLPDRVQTLAEDLTRDYDNDYDKIKAIEQYLVKFPYTLTPETVPRDRDFVDFFLFDGQEGYCTYYATAMAVMSRCIGLPSRYVEGYLMPEKQESDGIYRVTNSLAHSWAEVYFEGFGWVPFEATAPYSYAFYEQTIPSDRPVFSSDFVQDSAYAEYLRQMAAWQEASPQIMETASASTFVRQPTFTDRLKQLVYILAGALLFSSVYYLFIGIRMLQEKVRHKKIKTLAINQQAQEYFKGILKMTRYYRYPIRENETPLQYADRIGKRFVFHNEKLSMIDLVRLYYKAKYDDATLNSDELNTIESAYFELIDYIRLYRRRQVFLWNRYVIRRM